MPTTITQAQARTGAALIIRTIACQLSAADVRPVLVGSPWHADRDCDLWAIAEAVRAEIGTALITVTWPDRAGHDGAPAAPTTGTPQTTNSSER